MRRRFKKLGVKARGSTSELLPKLLNLSMVEDSGILSVGVKSVDIKRNTGGESDYLGYY